MIRPFEAKTLFAMGMILMAIGESSAQISILKKPDANGVWAMVDQGLQLGDPLPIYSRGVAPDFSASLSLAAINFPDEYKGEVSAQEASISGAISKRETWEFNSSADSQASYVMNIYADVVPGSKVRLKFHGNYQISWSTGNVLENHAGFLFTPESGAKINGGVTKPGYLMPYGNLSNGEQFSVDLQASATQSTTEGGKTYYKLGNFSITGRGVLGSTNSGESVSYRAEISNFQVSYIGPALSMADSNANNQVGHTQETLPQVLKIVVANTGTGEPVSGIPIVFTLADPAKGGNFTGGGSSFQIDTQTDGTASTTFTLGSSTGIYKVFATCPANVCNPDANKIEFIATARDKALACEGGICSLHGHVSETFSNPFIVKVIDKVTGQSVNGAQVSYEVIRFVDSNQITHIGGNGGAMAPNPAITEAGGGYSYFTPGAGEGTYVIRARCANCLEVPEQILYAGAGAYVRKEMGEAITADPSANETNCPSGCCPVTPMVRMGMVLPPNDGSSFTSAANENNIGLDARVLPACLNADNNVTWEVADAPGDFMDSGTPAQPIAGPISYFTVGSGTFPPAPTGRPLPLSYKVTASVMHNGAPQKTTAIVRQDEIDKCRQEYIDFGIPLTEVSRNVFTIGVGNDPAMVKYKDCFAHIYPSRAQEAKDLEEEYSGVVITNGYRSPRRNWDIYKDRNPTARAVRTSWHMFGKAVDLDYLPHTAQNWATLWDAADNPKILEASGGVPMIKRDTGGALTIFDPYKEPSLYGSGYCLHLGE